MTNIRASFFLAAKTCGKTLATPYNNSVPIHKEYPKKIKDRSKAKTSRKARKRNK